MSKHLEAAWLERSWVDLKQNPYLYGVNKTVSVLLAAGLATITLLLRASVTKDQVICETEDYKFLYWMLFVFYSFQGIGELYEAFLVLNGNEEKGLIGLLFEINYFGGIYITYRVVQAVYRSPQCAHTAPAMYRWLVYQTILFYACCIVSMLLCLCQWKIQRRVTKRRFMHAYQRI